MDRLTKQINGEACHYDCNGPCGTCDGCTCFEIGQMVDRLSAYEDICYSEDGTEHISIDRLRQLSEADRDGRIVVMDEPVNISYKSQLSNLSELLEDAAEKIDDRCRAWMCIYQRAKNDLDKIKGDIGLTAYKECLTMVDSIGQKCAEAEAALKWEEDRA